MLSNNKTISSLNNSTKFEKQTGIPEDPILIRKVDSVVNEINLKISNTNKKLESVKSKILKFSINNLSTFDANQLSTRCQKSKEMAMNFTFYNVEDEETLKKLLSKSNSNSGVEATNLYNYRKNYLVTSFSDNKDILNYYFVFFDFNSSSEFEFCQIPLGLIQKSFKKGVIHEIQKSSNEDYLSNKFQINSEACGLIDERNLLIKDSILLSKNKQDIFGYTYIGEFKNKLRDGYGILINLFQDTIFKGIWKNDIMLNGSFYAYNEKKHGNCDNGFGCLVYDNGSVYVGDFKNSQANGKGEYYSSVKNGTSYKYINGNWLDNKIIPTQSKEKNVDEIRKENEYSIVIVKANGDLRILSKNKSKSSSSKATSSFALSWDDCEDIFNYWTDGSVFFGKISNENKNGTTYWSNGTIYIGTDEINSPNIDGFGKFIYKGGEIRSGQFVDSKLTGMGTIVTSTGKVNEGYYEKGVLVQTKQQFEQEQKELDVVLRQRAYDREQRREIYPDRECASCQKVFCCEPGYQFEDNGQITSDKNYVTNYCSADCAKKGFNKLDNMYKDAKRTNQYKNEKCDQCYGNGTVNCFNNYGDIQKCKCSSCNGTGRKYN